MPLSDLADFLGQLEVEECARYREALIEVVNAATRRQPPGQPLAGEQFDDATPLVVLLRAIGALARAGDVEPARMELALAG